MHPFYMSRWRIHSSPDIASFMNMHPFDTPWSRRWIAIFACIKHSMVRLCNMHNEGGQVYVFDTIAAMFDRALFRHILCNSNGRLTNYNDPRKVNIHAHGPCILLITFPCHDSWYIIKRAQVPPLRRPEHVSSWHLIVKQVHIGRIVKLMLSWRRARRVCLHIPLCLNISDILRAA